MKTSVLLTLALIGSFIAGHMLLAQTVKAGDACDADIAKLCKSEKPGGNRMVRCLLGHENELSRSCRDHVPVMQEQTKGFWKCGTDAKKYCEAVKLGEGKIVRCLKQNQDKLSRACKSYLEAE